MLSNQAVDSKRLTFFLGGRDLEMVTIRELVEAHAPRRWFDKGLAWGARTSAYRDEIEACLTRGGRPVLIELEDDLGLPADRITLVDHHRESAGADRATSLEQVFHLLGLPPEQWTRRLALVAANDRGHVREMARMGASPEEMREIRALDRRAQGVGPEEEAAAERAAGRVEHLAGGRLTLARLPHARASALADRLQPELGGSGFENLLVFSPAEVNFFGHGELIAALGARFPGSWWGGALPESGFWGRSGDGDEVLTFLLEHLSGEPTSE